MYKQVRQFNKSKMGTKSGWCLLNVCLAYGIGSGSVPSAKADMENQKKAGTFHTDAIPSNVAVPVYLDTTSEYEHIGVMDKGTFYSDGKVADIRKFKLFGWGECVAGVRVVERTSEPKKGFLPTKGYWTLGDRDERVEKLASFMYKTFPAYTKKTALGNYYGKNLKASITEFQKRTGLEADGSVGRKTYDKLKAFGFKYGSN